MGFDSWFKFESMVDMLDWGRTCHRMHGVAYEHADVLCLTHMRGIVYGGVQTVVSQRVHNAVGDAVDPYTVHIA